MKQVCICILIACMLLCCASCGNPAAQPETTAASAGESDTPTSAAEWVSLLRVKIPFDDQMSETSQAAAIYGIADEDGYTGETAMLISTMATPEEVAVLQADDVYSVQTLTELAQARIEQQKASYASYAPQEMPKLDTAVIKTVGNYVIVCVSADNTLAAQLIDMFS